MRVLGLKRALLVAVALMQEPVPELLGLLGQIQVELPEQVAAQTDRVLLTVLVLVLVRQIVAQEYLEQQA